MQGYSNDVLSPMVFPRDFSRGYLEREEVMKIGNSSSRREHSTTIRTATEVSCFLLDILLVLTGHLVSFWLRFDSGFAVGPLFTDSLSNPTFHAYVPHFVLGGILFSMMLVQSGAYRRNALLRRQASFQAVSRASAKWIVIYLLVTLFFRLDPPIARTFVLTSGLLIVPLLLLGRVALLNLVHRSDWGDKMRTRLLVVGWSPQAGELCKGQVKKDTIHPIYIVGCVPMLNEKFSTEPPKSVPRLGKHKDLENLLVTGDFDGVLLADINARPEDVAGLRDLCYREHADFLVVPSFFEVLLTGLHLEMLGKVPVLGTSRLPLDSTFNQCVKRMIDIVGGIFGLVTFGPLMLIAMLFVWAESPGPVVYRQVRSGRLGRNFRMMKIRTMKLDAEKETGPKWATPKDDRRLRCGAFLRKWNIDELPQFWHVLTGEMTLVGPRPERPEFIRNFKHEVQHYNVRHAAKPGMTGWAQISGFRGNTSLEDRVRADLWYLENWSIWLDFYIMFATLFKKQKNAY